MTAGLGANVAPVMFCAATPAELAAISTLSTERPLYESVTV